MAMKIIGTWQRSGKGLCGLGLRRSRPALLAPKGLARPASCPGGRGQAIDSSIGRGGLPQSSSYPGAACRCLCGWKRGGWIRRALCAIIAHTNEWKTKSQNPRLGLGPTSMLGCLAAPASLRLRLRSWDAPGSGVHQLTRLVSTLCRRPEPCVFLFNWFLF